MNTVKWTRDRICQAIRDCNGSSTGNPTLCTVARRMFGTWQAACLTAGIKAAGDSPQFTKCTIDGCAGKPRSLTSPYCDMHYCRFWRTGDYSVKNPRVISHICRVCNKSLPSKRWSYCSKECSKAAQVALMKSAWAMRRSIYATGDIIHKRQIFERDHWKCQLCGRQTPKRLQGKRVYNAPELDHIVPLRAGGAHVIENVHCVCRKCNMAKGKKPLGQQWLFGFAGNSIGQIRSIKRADYRDNRKFVEHNGQREILVELAKKLGLSRSGLHYRLTRWPLEKVIDSPLGKRGPKKGNKPSFCVHKEWKSRCSICRKEYKQRRYRENNVVLPAPGVPVEPTI